jgi:hypothetical protein
MKITNFFIIDMLIHIIIILLINIYIVRVSSITEFSTILLISIIFGVLITYVNYLYFPKLQLQRVLKNIQK